MRQLPASPGALKAPFETFNVPKVPFATPVANPAAFRGLNASHEAPPAPGVPNATLGTLSVSNVALGAPSEPRPAAFRGLNAGQEDHRFAVSFRLGTSSIDIIVSYSRSYWVDAVSHTPSTRR